MYNVVVTECAMRDIERLDKTTKKRIGEKLKLFCENPFHYSRKLSKPEAGSFRFRIGDYRVIFDIDGDNIVILRVGHRSEIYAK